MNKEILLKEIKDIGLNDEDFKGKNFDQCIKLICDSVNTPTKILDNISQGEFPNLYKAVNEKHQGSKEIAYTIDYDITSNFTSSSLTLKPNNSVYQYDYLTDNYGKEVIKYGDFCRENIKNNHFTSANLGNYIFKLKNTSSKIKIVTYGDSITLGVDSKHGTNKTYHDDNGEEKTTKVTTSYPQYLSSALNEFYPGRFEVQNYSWSGSTTQEHHSHFWKNKNADVCIIMLGTNDDNHDVKGEVYEQYLSLIIERNLYFGTLPILIGQITRREKGMSQSEIYLTIGNNLAKKYNLPYIDGSVFSEYMDSSLYSDNTHFNKNGYKYMGSKIVASLFIDNNIFKKQKVKSGDILQLHDLASTSLIYKSGDATIERSSNYPTVGSFDDEFKGKIGGCLRIQPKGKVYLPFYCEEETINIVPHVYLGVAERKLYTELADDAITVQAKNAYYNYDVLTGDLKRYHNNKAQIDSSKANFRNKSVFNLIGAIQQKTNPHYFCTAVKGENLLTIYNNGENYINVYGIEFISELDYMIATGLPSFRK